MKREKVTAIIGGLVIGSGIILLIIPTEGTEISTSGLIGIFLMVIGLIILFVGWERSPLGLE